MDEEYSAQPIWVFIESLGSNTLHFSSICLYVWWCIGGIDVCIIRAQCPRGHAVRLCYLRSLPHIEGYFRKVLFRRFRRESKQSAVSVHSSARSLSWKQRKGWIPPGTQHPIKVRPLPPSPAVVLLPCSVVPVNKTHWTQSEWRAFISGFLFWRCRSYYRPHRPSKRIFVWWL